MANTVMNDKITCRHYFSGKGQSTVDGCDACVFYYLLRHVNLYSMQEELIDYFLGVKVMNLEY